MEVYARIFLDSFMGEYPDLGELRYMNEDEFMVHFPLVRNIELVVRLYNENYDFTDDELIILLEDLRYIGSSRIMEVLVIIKCRQNPKLDKKINVNLLKDYNSINLSKIKHVYTDIELLTKIAVVYDLVNILKYFIDEYDSNIINKLLKISSENGSVKVVQLLLRNGADIHADDDYSLLLASENGHLEVVKLLLKNGADIHSDYDYSLRLASKNGHLEVVKFLLNYGADVNVDDDYSLQLALENGRLEVAELLLNYGANVNVYNSLPLYIAIKSENLEAVELLLAHEAIVTEKIIGFAKNKGNNKILKILQTYI